VCIAGIATETQVLFPTEDEARAYATSGAWAGVAVDGDGIRLRRPAGVSQDGRLRVPEQGNRASSVLGADGAHGGLTLVPPAPDEPPQLAGVTLAEAVDDGLIGMKLATVQRASTRDPEFPPPVGKRGPANTYDPAELMVWQRNRPRAAS
jgi:hypothetical protein